MIAVDWTRPYLAHHTIHLWLRAADDFVARNAETSVRHSELDTATLQVLSCFSSPRTPRDVYDETSPWTGVSEAEFEAVLQALLVSDLLKVAAESGSGATEVRPVVGPGLDRPLGLSKHASLFELERGHAAIGHPLLDRPLVVEQRLAQVLERLAQSPRSAVEIARDLDMPSGAADELVRFLASKLLLVPPDHDEGALIRELLSSRFVSGGDRPPIRRQNPEGETPYHLDAPLRASDFRVPLPIAESRSIKVLILGSCLTQFTAEILEREGPGRKLQVATLTGFPQDVDLIDQWQPDVVLLHLAADDRMNAPLWDQAPFIDANERARRLEHLQVEVRHKLRRVAKRAEGRLLLVLGFSAPAISPLGLYEFREALSFSRLVFELNQAVQAEIRDNPNALFIDEERVVSNAGKLRLLDDCVVPYSHHGPLDQIAGHPVPGPSRGETFDLKESHHLVRLLATEVLDAYLAWSGMGRIKCIVVDLDRTLWPWVLGEEPPVLDDHAFASFREGVWGGIHQALKIVKQRGVLLATCSKNDPDDVFERWAELSAFADQNGLSHIVLRPEDFVLHQINWDRKSGNIAALADKLGLAQDAILFVDDSALERAEVAYALPAVRLLGENLNLVRHSLLTDPCLAVNLPSAEAQRRTEMVQAQLERESARRDFPDEASFLRSLGIRLRITLSRADAPLARYVELLQRTNQLNTTLVRHDAGTLERMLASPDHAIYALEVSDCFGAHGIVGLCILDGSRIDSFLVSCRVIGLRVALPFLVSILRQHDRFPLEGRIVDGPRNHPCRGLYREAGFHEVGQGRFQLARGADLVPLDPTVHPVEWA
jgi:FkbH-like protein